VAQSAARVVLVNIAADPTWGPYAQRLSVLDTDAIRRGLQDSDALTLTYIEGAGDCMVYAIALERRTDGSFAGDAGDPQTPRPVRTHWCWGAAGLPKGNTLTWAGIHATVLGEAYVRPRHTLAAIGVRPPTYPDGRPAVGRVSGVAPPLDAELWDACAAKDLNGRIRPIFAAAIGVAPGQDAPEPLREGLYRAVAGADALEASGLAPGQAVWCGCISVHKDLSAPFWRDYARASARTIARAGVNGVWCDNWSPWDNFGYPPVHHAFGEWSRSRFREWLADGAPTAVVVEAGLSAGSEADVRARLKDRARSMGSQDPSNLDDAVWSDRRWLDDPAWRLYKAGRQIQARSDLRAFHRSLRSGAREGGNRDFLVCANDIPFYALGWARDSWTDMVHTEVTPGWHMGAGTRGIMLPPYGRMAVVYRAALAHQSGRHCAGWYYLDGPNEQYRGHEGLARVLMSEALANGAVLLCDPAQARVTGSVATHWWLNTFMRSRETALADRTPVGDVGVVFSPDCQLYELAPGGFPDMDQQPHVFGHWGWGTVLMEAHVPYVVVPDWRLNDRMLQNLRALVLPDVVCMDDASVAAIERWVRAGGRLVATGACGVRQGTGGAFALRERGGILDRLGAPPGKAWQTHQAGRGHVVCCSAPAGMEYYWATSARRSELIGMAHLVGAGKLLAAPEAPSTVEIGLWRSADRRGLDVDLANVGIDLGADTLPRVGHVGVRISPPWPGDARITLRTPDCGTRATHSQDRTGVTIEVKNLLHYASVRIERP
jgi:hypothetical protein